MANDQRFVVESGLQTQNIEYLSPSGTDKITVSMLDGGTLSYTGTSGQLFSVTNSLTGTLFTINDVSGIPSFEVDDTGVVRIAQYTGNVLIGTATDNGTKLQVSGSAWLSNNSVQLAFNRPDAAGPDWHFYSWNSGLNIYPVTTASTVWIGRDGANTDLQLYNGNLYAPIMYDFNNTAYYVDPASNSYINQLSIGSVNTSFALYNNSNSYFNGPVQIDDTLTITGSAAMHTIDKPTTGSYQTVLRVGTTTGGLYLTSDNAIISKGAYYNNGWINTSGGQATNMDMSSGFNFQTGTGTIGSTQSWTSQFVIDTSGNTISSASSRAPIFYDTNDTNYYVDPNGTSNINSSNITGTLAFTHTGTLISHSAQTDAIGYNPSYGTYIGSPVSGTYYVYGNGTFNNNGTITRLAAYGYNYASSLYASIYYDADNTAYYVDPASTSNLNTVNISTLNVTSTSSHIITIAPDGPNADFNTQTSNSYVSALYGTANSPFGNNTWYNLVNIRHRGGGSDGNNYGGQIAIGMTGYTNRIAFRSQDNGTWNSWYELASFDNNTSTGSLYAGIYYDSNNTAYYSDPTGTSSMNQIIFQQGSTSRTAGIIGLYDPTRIAAIWSMGSAYQIATDGSTGGTLYGMCYSYNPNYGSTGTNPGAINGLNHQFQWRANGATQTAIGTGVYTVGEVTAYSDARIKTNLEIIPDAINKIKQINGYTFDRLDKDIDPETGAEIDKPRQAGVIAQEIQKVLPEVVRAAQETGHLSVAYDRIVALLIEGIKEQQSQIEELQKQIQELRNGE